YLAEAQREATRPLILAADAGMTGCNFAVAETGTFVVCTNEGNADLSANVPKLHIASIGIEKIIPRLERLAVFVRLLSRSALGSPVTQYSSHFRGPRAGGEMHVVLVDNGRSERLGLEEFWTSLKCIRCGACMNTCPVYRRSGGLSYGATYSGHHPARDARALAPGRLSLLLALEVAPKGRATADRHGAARIDPADERGESALGRAAHPRRTAQARV